MQVLVPLLQINSKFCIYVLEAPELLEQVDHVRGQQSTVLSSPGEKNAR